MLDSPLFRRPRRNRRTPAIRDLAQETRLHPSNLIAPLFLLDGNNRKETIESMPGVFRLSLDHLLQEARSLYEMGILAINLYPVVPLVRKDERGSYATHPDSFFLKAIRVLKEEIPGLCLIPDVALDPYTNHGHDGLLASDGSVLNDETVAILAKISCLFAKAGADIVAPSDMMDGRVFHIRKALDEAGYQHVGIMSYTAKYASSLYRPFREALHSTPRFGDKKGYQMNPANVREALLESDLDEREGADFLLVKPALPYLDVLTKIRERSCLPIIAYQVSGEYAMIMAAAEKGWLDGDQALYECALSIKRAGADSIITYGAKRLVQYLSSEEQLTSLFVEDLEKRNSGARAVAHIAKPC